MRRREFITLLIGAAVGWPMAARAQQPAVPVIGFLGSASRDEHLMAAFYRGLKETGYVEGQNVAIEYRWAEGHYDRLPPLVADLVRRQVNVIATIGGELSGRAAKAATSTIPIVATANDALRAGLVSNLARPDENLTAVNVFTAMLAPKQLDLLRQLLPKAKVIAVLINPNYPSAVFHLKEVEEAGRAIGLQFNILHANADSNFDTVFESLAQQPADALLVLADPSFLSRRDQIVASANHYAVPAIYELREFASAGGLMSYGTDIADAYRQVGVYAGRILKGAKPADLPVMQPTKFQLVINLKTAKALGLTVPPTLLAIADAVIE